MLGFKLALALALVTALSTVSLAVAQPNGGAGSGAPTIFGTTDQWTILEGSDRCAMFATYERDNASLSIHYIAGNNTAYAFVKDDRFKSLKEGATQSLHMFFVRGKGAIEDWGDVTVYGTEDDDGQKGFYVKLDGADFLADVAKSKLLAFTRDDDDVMVTSLELKGSGGAVSKLRQCGQKMQRQNPIDPFAS